MSENDLIRRGDAKRALILGDTFTRAQAKLDALPAAPTFTAADLERAWEMGRDACIGILECELELARAADRTTALVLAITCRAMNGETPPADLAQRVKEDRT